MEAAVMGPFTVLFLLSAAAAVPLGDLLNPQSKILAWIKEPLRFSWKCCPCCVCTQRRYHREAQRPVKHAMWWMCHCLTCTEYRQSQEPKRLDKPKVTLDVVSLAQAKAIAWKSRIDREFRDTEIAHHSDYNSKLSQLMYERCKAETSGMTLPPMFPYIPGARIENEA